MNYDSTSGAGDFVLYAKYLLRAEGRPQAAAHFAEQDRSAPARVISVLKASVAAGATDNPSWAGALLDHRIISASFIDSLRNISVFDRLQAQGMRIVPLRTRLAIATVGATASIVEEGLPAPISALSLKGQDLEVQKSVCILVVTDEITSLSSGPADALLGRELRGAVAAETNRAFLSNIATGAQTFNSSGSTPANILADVETLLDAVAPTAASRLFLVVDGVTAGKLATKAGADGSTAFPGMSPLGGEIAGIPVIVSDQVQGGSSGGHGMMLIDAYGIAGGSDVIVLDTSKAATIQMSSTPTLGSQNLVSLFQSNSKALRATRYFGFELLRDNAVAIIEDANY